MVNSLFYILPDHENVKTGIKYSILFKEKDVKKKLLALLTALAMVCCLCTTTFAADSPSDSTFDKIDAPYVYASGTSEEGLTDNDVLYIDSRQINTDNCTPEEFEAAKTLADNEEEVVKVLEENGVDVPADAKMVLISAGEYDAYVDHYEYSEEYGYNVWTGGGEYEGQLDLTLDLDGLDVEDGDTVYVLHYTSEGTWEVFECVVEDGTVTIDVASLSPIMVYKMMSDGTATPVEPDPTDPTEEPTEEPTDTPATEEPATTTATATTTAAASTTKTVSTVKTSPYTGA